MGPGNYMKHYFASYRIYTITVPHLTSLLVLRDEPKQKNLCLLYNGECNPTPLPQSSPTQAHLEYSAEKGHSCDVRTCCAGTKVHCPAYHPI